MTLVAAGLSLAGCDDGGAAAGPAPPGRVVAVQAKQSDEDPIDAFCDVKAGAGGGKAFALPEAVEGTAQAPTGAARWVNVWATWCKPCVEEIPMLVEWQKRMQGEGVAWNLQLLSVDQEASAVESFRAEHARVPPTLRLTDPEALAPFVGTLGLDSGAGLPIHVFVDASDKMRCVRAGAVVATDYDTVARILR